MIAAYDNPKWEYLITHDYRSFDAFGAEGWELVTVDGSRAHFKRRVRVVHDPFASAKDDSDG